MSESKYTPGPWFDWENKKWIHEPKKLLANYEDACLIAAAPELLEACETMLTELRAYVPEDEHDDEAPNKALFDMLKSAIAKGRGEEINVRN